MPYAGKCTARGAPGSWQRRSVERPVWSRQRPRLSHREATSASVETARLAAPAPHPRSHPPAPGVIAHPESIRLLWRVLRNSRGKTVQELWGKLWGPMTENDGNWWTSPFGQCCARPLQTLNETHPKVMCGKSQKKQRLRLGCEGSAVQICPSRPFKLRNAKLKTPALPGTRQVCFERAGRPQEPVYSRRAPRILRGSFARQQ